MTRVDLTCMWCHEKWHIEAPEEGLAAWKSGVLIQNALPELSDDEREALISSTHPWCWDTMMEEREGWEDDWESEGGHA